MRNKRLAIIGIITVIIFIIAVFLWLNINLLINRNAKEDIYQEPPKQTSQDQDKETEILDVLKRMDEKKEGLATEEKKKEILNILQSLDNATIVGTNTTSTKAVISDEKKAEIMEALNKINN